jgi:multidrug efflux pump subunit AcrB
VRLSVPGSRATHAGLIESLAGVPGVLDVDPRGSKTSRRLWLLGPDLDRLTTLARGLGARFPGLDVHVEDPRPTLAVEPDLDSLARLGIARAEFDHELALARGVELGTLLDGEGTPIPIILRSAGPTEADPDSLEDLTLGHGEHAVPLGAVATLERRAMLARICRHDGRRGILLGVPAGLADQVGPAIEAELAPGDAWAWADEAG